MYKCERCGKPMEHLCADVFVCYDCLIMKSEIFLIKERKADDN